MNEHYEIDADGLNPHGDVDSVRLNVIKANRREYIPSQDLRFHCLACRFSSKQMNALVDHAWKNHWQTATLVEAGNA